MSLCGRLGPVFLSSAVQTGRYPGTRMSVDPVYKVARSGARVEEMRWRDRTVIDGILGIDVCKNTLDVSISSYTKVRTKSFTNSPDGWRHLLDWLIAQKIQRVHACLESTGRYSLGIACALYEADHVVSIINPAQIRDFVRTKLGRNKTDGVDASHIREYCELFKPSPWAPPSKAHRRLGELQTIRSGIIAGLTEWKNRKNSGIVDAEAQALADATISHFTSQLEAVDKAIALTIDNDSDLRSKRDLLLSISGVGDTLAGVVLAELPGPDVLRSSGEVVAYAGLNPRQHQSGTSVDRATRISKIGNERSSRCTIHAGPIRHAVQSRNCGASNSVEVPRSPQTQADCRGRDAEAFGAVFRCSKNGQTFRSRNSDGLLSHIQGSIACRISVGGGGGGHAPQPEGARGSARA